LPRCDQRRPRYGDGAGQLEGLLREHARGSEGRDDRAGAPRRRSAAHPAGEVPARVCSKQASRRNARSAASSNCSARPSTVRSPARPCANRWCC
jgi:hypothetical protein